MFLRGRNAKDQRMVSRLLLAQKTSYGRPFRTWAPKAGGGLAGRVPHSREISGGRPPRNERISVTFFLTRVKISHFPTFSK